MQSARQIDVVLLGGGRSRRMGQDKASLVVAGRRLIDHVLDDLAGLPQVSRVVVVAPDELPVPPGVLQTMEEPPGGGPVAGLLAGLDELGSHPDDWVGVLTCDAPRAARLIPQLFAAALGNPGVDGVLADAGGRRQYLCAVYRARALRAGVVGSAHGHPMHRLASRLRTIDLRVSDELATDLDDMVDVSRFLAQSNEPDIST